jgi:hypothetical protein
MAIFDIYKTINEKINKILETKFKQLKETRKLFEKMTHDLDNAYQKNGKTKTKK